MQHCMLHVIGVMKGLASSCLYAHVHMHSCGVSDYARLFQHGFERWPQFQYRCTHIDAQLYQFTVLDGCRSPVKSAPSRKAAAAPKRKAAAPAAESEDEESEDDKPLAAKKKAAAPGVHMREFTCT